MAGFFLAFSLRGEPLCLSEATWGAVREAMGERCPGAITEVSSGSFRCLYGGHDAEVLESSDFFLVTDGRPRLHGPLDGGSGSSALEALARAWRTRREDVLPSLDGSFSFCLVDEKDGELALVRDPFGSRPLFWHQQDGWVFAASECKVLSAVGVPLRLSQRVLSEVLWFRWITGTRHLLDPINQIPQGSVVRFRDGSASPPKRYWRLPIAPEEGGTDALAWYRDLAADALEQSIAEAVGGRGEVGVLLSGGVDSSVIAGIARKTVGRCIGYAARIPDSPNTELKRALLVAEHLGIECRVVDVPGPTFTDDLRSMVRRIEEPPRHPNNVVLEALFRGAANEVDLVLHGEGAEMVFGLADTRTVERFRKKHRIVAPIHRGFRASLARGLRATDSSLAERLARVLSWDPMMYGVLIDRIRYSIPVQRKLRHLIGSTSPGFLPLDHFEVHENFDDALHAFQAHTFLTPTLTRHDRLAQPLGITSESPFLRRPVVDVGCRIPRDLRFTDASRPVLRALCDRHFPPEFSRWPKLAFPVPWDTWVQRAGFCRRLPASNVAGLLPEGFQELAVAVNDPEALWTAVTLSLLVEEFRVRVDSWAVETQEVGQV